MQSTSASLHLRRLQLHAHERRCAALAAAIAEGLLEEDALDYTPTAMLMDEDMVSTDSVRLWQGLPVVMLRASLMCPA